MSTTVAIVATGSTLPSEAVSNREIGRRLLNGTEVDDEASAEIVARISERAELIEKKTGLRSRRFFPAEESPVHVGMELLERMMRGQRWSELDAIVVSSSSTHGFPGLSQQVVAAARERHSDLGAPFVLDIGSNACTGFMYALTVASSVMQALGYRRVACLALEFSSRCIAYDPLAFGTSTLFGDAAAGVLLARDTRGLATLCSVRATSMIDKETIAMVRGSGMQAAHPTLDVPKSARWFMAGPPVAIGATRILIDEIERVQNDGVNIDWLIPHQANLTRILLPACAKTGIDPERLCASFADTGNTSSASIPLLLDQLLRSGRARCGEHALMIGFGASFSIGSALIRFDEPVGAD
ncbi:MAG TPA: 3-oxoacyl-[acyl-carrier-protein] synthase III C-terminal domain-containing protein [Burkholderiaceae bacterium]|nr:3-oxoacyl-[acyl-carrier-protein] synthase III C-terminal domain-containing protein [Burkholderiaceae bacterium]